MREMNGMEWSLEDLLNLDGRSNTSRSLEFGEINELIIQTINFLRSGMKITKFVYETSTYTNLNDLLSI